MVYKLGAYAKLDLANFDEIKLAVSLLGCSSIGLELPLMAQKMNGKWDIPAGQSSTGDWTPGSWGGHNVIIPKYDAETFVVVTWGQVWLMTPAHAPISEAWALVSNDFLLNGRLAPDGLDYQAMIADMRLIAAGPP